MDFEALQEQFSNLDPENIGSWPMVVRGFILVVLCAAILGAGYYFDTQHQIVELDRAVAKEATLKDTFEKKQKKAASLDAYKAQMKEMMETFGTMLRQLPSKNEVAELLVDITQTGLASGLEFELFKPGKESPKDFYAELPISVKVNGMYHSLGEFTSGVAALPRIVTMHDIKIRGNKKGELLIMEATAKTYRYLDDDEIAAAGRGKKNSRKRSRR